MSLSAEAPEPLSAVLARVDESPASFLRAARELSRPGVLAGLKPVKVGVLSTFTADLLIPYLVVEAARRNLALTVEAAPFGQLEQQVLSPTSELHRASPEVIVLAVRVEDVATELVDGFAALGPEAVHRSIETHVARIGGLVRGLRERSAAQILVWNQPPLARMALGIADASTTPSQSEAIASLNAQLVKAVQSVSGAFLFDAARLATEVGIDSWHDAKLQHLGRIPIGAKAQVAVAARSARYLRALTHPARKCLVLDLDNTLWGGVLGEDGLGGIKLGEESPGNAFKTFQRQVKSYRDRGVILAIASKNNPADAAEAFEKHEDMVLRWDDFAARQVHWNDKAQSLAAIAEELNIGTDSLVFFDDNPVEREWVRSRMPEVLVVDVPTDPLRYGAALDATGAFDQLVVTGEDRKRAQTYQQQAQRRDLEANAGSVDDFLRALEMRVVLGDIDAATIPRVTQLLGKTNQFNVTTRRHSEADLQKMLASGAVGLWMRVEDRFGDNGLVGVAIAKEREPGAWIVDSFLMSCRVLGRKAELALLSEVTARVVGRGGRQLFGEFIPTKKNAPAAGFFAEAGFSQQSDGLWQMDLSRGAMPPPTLMTFVRTNG